MLIPDLEQQERTARSLPVQQNDPKRTETDTISRNIMDLDDLTWALTEEQIVASKELKMRAALKKSFQSLCPLVLF